MADASRKNVVETVDRLEWPIGGRLPELFCKKKKQQKQSINEAEIKRWNGANVGTPWN